MVGSAAPAAISNIAITNCISPTASAIQWHNWTPRMNPPHTSRTKGRPMTLLEALSGSQSSWSLHGIAGSAHHQSPRAGRRPRPPRRRRLAGALDNKLIIGPAEGSGGTRASARD
ncbi:hypothetical protein ACMD2_09175 [Ananas comosus]|uniref:Uncharacterized protein n=1 Tax=Ananas comosus TaxID=4615 RepID=A0A199V1F9_ANACO|nr:hypothetical protein ACMD2_09175 [Ananas comosus]